jgi:hypothetical protein
LDEPPEVIGTKNNCHHCFPFVFSELPSLFYEFEQLPYGIINYKPNPSMEVDIALQSFTGLSSQEFSHCFMPGHQDPYWCGVDLDLNATPEEVGRNLLSFINCKLNLRLYRLDL